jgi:hypothetical protein
MQVLQIFLRGRVDNRIIVVDMPVVVLAREGGSLTIALIFDAAMKINCSCSHLCKSQEGEKRVTTRDRPYNGRIC